MTDTGAANLSNVSEQHAHEPSTSFWCTVTFLGRLSVQWILVGSASWKHRCTAFLADLALALVLYLLYDSQTELKNCMGPYVALWRTNSFEILSQYWEAIRKHTDNQLPPDWTTTGTIGFIILYFVQTLINCMVKQKMAAALMAAGSKGKWQVLSAACCSV